MATSTYKSFLMHKTSSGSTYEKLVDITEFPDLGGKPEMLETTTLSDPAKTYIAGIQDTASMDFKANYDKTDYTALKALEGKTEKYAVWFGAATAGTPDGSEGKFEFDGQLSVYVDNGGVNAVRTMTISIAPSTVISFS